MGGVQSSAHNLGDALWMHERQRQRGQRDAGGRYETQEGQNFGSQDRCKLLKRTRSLAVITEDTLRNEGETNSRQFHLGEPDLESPRRPQLIPRAKLIDRNSLKDRLSKSQQHLSDSYERFNDSRSYHSHSTCELYSVPSGLTSLPDPPLYGRTSRADPDRLNILDWPRTPRRYRSHQDLDTVSGLVDIVEDEWPIDDNRNVDCIYTQVKRKRKEHRSLDSILHEDDDELEYFDVLNLLPLSKVRLQFDESDARSDSWNNNSNNFGNNRSSNFGNFGSSNHGSLTIRSREFVNRAINEGLTSSEADDDDEDEDHHEDNELTEDSELSECRRDEEEIEITEILREAETKNFGKNFTDEEKCKSQPKKLYPEIVEFHERRDERDSWRGFASFELGKSVNDEVTIAISESLASSELDWPKEKFNVDRDEDTSNLESPSTLETESETANVKDLLEKRIINKEKIHETSQVTTLKEIARRSRSVVEEAEDYKSIWISDTEEPEEMSRRPQILKVVDNEVTKRGGRASSVVEIDVVAREIHITKDHDDAQAQKDFQSVSRELTNFSGVRENEDVEDSEKVKMEPSANKDKTDVETARNFFESKSTGKEITRKRQNEGRFERIVKETTNMLGKACNAVRDSLGFEARSESSDLGLGSDCGSDTRRRSIDDGVDVVDDVVRTLENSQKPLNKGQINEDKDETTKNGRKSRTNLTRSRSCVDSIESQDDEGQEFDHVRYKIVKSRLFGKNIFGNAVNKRDVTYDGLMEYLREYSFQELLMDNNVVIIEPVRAETIDRKSSSSISKKDRSSAIRKVSGSIQKKFNNCVNGDRIDDKMNDDENCLKSPKQSSLRKHFFYHPIRVNRELIDEELPDPDTVRNVRRMFENTLRSKSASKSNNGSDCKSRKSVSMKDLRRIEEPPLDDVNERVFESSSRSRSSSRAKDLTRLFEGLDKTSPSQTNQRTKQSGPDSSKNETKTRILAQSFEARSGTTSPSDSGSTRNKMARYRHANQHDNHHHHHHRRRRRRQQNWETGSVSSGVSSDYPDTDPGSNAHCTSSEDEEIDIRDEYESNESDRVSGHFVSQDVLRKIRECGTSVTYYGGKVVNTCNGPLISPMSCKLGKRIERSLIGNEDYVKFRLVKSNSCDSRLELTGRVIERRSRLEARESALKNDGEKNSTYIRESTIAETPSIEIMSIDNRIEIEERNNENEIFEAKREPPIVIGLEPKKDESKETNGGFKADFKLGKIDDTKSIYVNRFGSALTRWQINETSWKKTNADFGKMEFEEFEVLEDSLNGNDD